jgi:hypothetical protein
LQGSAAEAHWRGFSISTSYAVFVLKSAQAIRVKAAHSIRAGYRHAMALFVVRVLLVVIRIGVVALTILIHLEVIMFLQLHVISTECTRDNCVILLVRFGSFMHQTVGGQ